MVAARVGVILPQQVEENRLVDLLVSPSQELATCQEEKVVSFLKEEELNTLLEVEHTTGRLVARLDQKEQRTTLKSDDQKALVINRGAIPVQAKDGLDTPRNLQEPHLTVLRKRLFASCTFMANVRMVISASFGTHPMQAL